MSIDMTEQDGCRVAVFRGFLDGAGEDSREAMRFFWTSPAEIDAPCIVDMSEVGYVNSGLLGAVVRFHAACAQAGHLCVVVLSNPDIRELLDLTGLSRLLPVVDDREKAVRVIRTSGSPEDPLPDVDFDALEKDIDEIALDGGVERSADQWKESEIGRLMGERPDDGEEDD